MPITQLIYTDRHQFDPTTDVMVDPTQYPFKGDGSPDMWAKAALRTTHRGRVIRTGERNSYDDSDFYAVVEDEAQPGVYSEIVYGSTRGWTYANHATVDATPDVLQRYEAHQAQIRNDWEEACRDREAKIARVGDRVTILDPLTRGRNAAEVGAQGTVRWVGVNDFRSNRWVTVSRLRVELDEGRTIFIDADRTDKPEVRHVTDVSAGL